MLDIEQVNCFILDSLCNDFYLNKLIDFKRKYEITLDFEQIDMENQVNFASIDGQSIGGINLKDNMERLPDFKRLEMKAKIQSLQQSLPVEREQTKKYPELQGVFKRLYADAGLKEERMEKFRS